MATQDAFEDVFVPIAVNINVFMVVSCDVEVFV